MTEERKALYRELLHRAMIDVRVHTSGSAHDFRRWGNPSRKVVLGFVNELTDWLHNVALYSAWDFENFDEEWFWRDYQIFRAKYPADKWALYAEGIVERLR